MTITFDRRTRLGRGPVLSAIVLLAALAGWLFDAQLADLPSQVRPASEPTEPRPERMALQAIENENSTARVNKTISMPTTKPTTKLRPITDIDSERPVSDALDVLDDFPAIAARARSGDATAMLGIGRTLQGCSSFEPTTVILPDGTTQSYSKRCGNIPAAERVPARVWLARAAAAGDLRAQVEFALEVNSPRQPADEATRAQAMEYLLMAARGGVEDAWLALIEAHRSGWYAPADAVEAAAWMLAMAQASPGALESHGGASLIEALRHHERMLAQERAARIAESMGLV